jgi:hypothetical protein
MAEQQTCQRWWESMSFVSWCAGRDGYYNTVRLRLRLCMCVWGGHVCIKIVCIKKGGVDSLSTKDDSKWPIFQTKTHLIELKRIRGVPRGLAARSIATFELRGRKGMRGRREGGGRGREEGERGLGHKSGLNDRDREQRTCDRYYRLNAPDRTQEHPMYASWVCKTKWHHLRIAPSSFGAGGGWQAPLKQAPVPPSTVTTASHSTCKSQNSKLLITLWKFVSHLVAHKLW